MAKWCRILGAWTVALGVLPAQPPAEPGYTACAREVGRLHGVWRTPRVYLPLWADWDTVEYLASLAGKASGGAPHPAVLPVFSLDPVHFRRGSVVFVSTGLIAQSGSEAKLLAAIRAEVKRKPRPEKNASPACACLSPASAETFAEVRARVASQSEAYAALQVERLKRRGGDEETVER